MFVGHYSVAFALRGRGSDVPLWQLFLGVQAVNILFFVLVPLGIERVTLRPDELGMLRLGLDYMPFSHSLVAALLWGALAASIGYGLRRPRAGIALGVAVASHWFIDLLVHGPDLPLATGEGTRVGLGLWNHLEVSYAIELVVLAVGFSLLAPLLSDRVRRRGVGLVLLMGFVHAITVFVAPAPPSPVVLAVSSEVAFVSFAAAAWWMERPAASSAPAPG